MPVMPCISCLNPQIMGTYDVNMSDLQDRKTDSKTKKAVLLGVAGSHNAFSLSLYNLKAFAVADPDIRKQWNLHVIQHPLINILNHEIKLTEIAEKIVAEKPELVAFSCYMWNV